MIASAVLRSATPSHSRRSAPRHLRPVAVGLLVLVMRLGSRGTAVAAETVTTLANLSGNTGEKPQSKVWFHEGRWWTVMPGPSGMWLWRLGADNHWTNLLRLSSNTSTTADTKVLGDVTHILLHGSSPQLVSVEYVPAGETYKLWMVRPTATSVSLPGSETATIDLDSKYTMWLSTENGSKVQVYYSEYPYTSFSGPLTLASNIHSDDITVVVALPEPAPPKVGVFWSNQVTKRFGFRVHRDDDAPTVWQADEVPASQSALNHAGGMADDHMNAAVASDGTLYLSIKTSYNSSGFPTLGLLVRRPNGSWDDLYEIDADGTRPMVLLNEAVDRLKVVFTTSSGGGNIVSRDSPVSPISFSSRKTLMTGSLNNATSTKDNWTDQVVILASGHGVLIRETSVGATTTTATTTTATTTTATTSTSTTTLGGSSTTTATTSSTTTTTIVGTPAAAVVDADVSVVAGSSTKFGKAVKLEVDGSPVKHTFVRFTVSGTAGHTITSAKLRLQIATSSGADSPSKGAVHVSTCGWDEATLAGTTQPQPAIGTQLDAPSGAAVPGQVVEFDVAGAVTGDGTYCVAIDSGSTDGVDYVSREASSGKPAVVVTVAP